VATSRTVAASPPRVALLLERHVCDTMAPVWFLCAPTGNHPAAASGVRSTGATGRKLLVLLSGSARLLSLHPKLRERMDEGGTGYDPARSIEEVTAAWN
jgi:hypothetical protein